MVNRNQVVILGRPSEEHMAEGKSLFTLNVPHNRLCWPLNPSPTEWTQSGCHIPLKFSHGINIRESEANQTHQPLGFILWCWVSGRFHWEICSTQTREKTGTWCQQRLMLWKCTLSSRANLLHPGESVGPQREPAGAERCGRLCPSVLSSSIRPSSSALS